MKFKFIYIISLLIFFSCKKDTSYFDSELSQIKDLIKKENITPIESDENNGVFYKLMKDSGTESIHPGKGSYISVQYSIKYINGTTAKSDTKAELYLYEAPKSWQLILPKMKEKQEMIIMSTSNISYSKKITDGLNTDKQPLYFYINLLSIK